MKKLITICLIMAATFAMQAQKKELNKDETIEYIDKLWKSSFIDAPSLAPISVKVDGKIIEVKNYDENVDGGIAKRRSTITGSTIFEITSFKPKYTDLNYSITIRKEEILDGISTYEDASRLKRALEHLQKLLETDDSDPFRN